ncbi:DNA-binding NarL/FixJ family response regulator [Flavobacteriaceae bacterium MAR_2010_105]|nr:DNA-binding NarL/FixJ family response regulator [Flavobacteriaceae bacterium MAR_2010_105]
MMFSKVLVAEDMDDINKGIYNTLVNLGVANIHQVQYCDDAYLKFKKALLEQDPYELLITDMSFKSDHRKQQLTTGEELIKKLRVEAPHLKVIIYSIEDRLQKVRMLVNQHQINAYVCKGRRGLVELSKAVYALSDNQLYLSPEVKNALNPNNDLEIDEYDIQLLTQLALGLSQDEISNHFTKHNISPSSLSSIEKRLNKLRIQFKANNAIHLVAIAKDLGLI